MTGGLAVLFVLLLSPVGRSGLLPADQEKYTVRWDYINVDEVLASERLVSNYVKCLLEKGPCSPDAYELKKTLPDALETGCSKCSEKQKSSSEKVIHFLIDNRKEDWKKLEEKYDPLGSYRLKYENELKKEDVSISPVTQ